MRNKLIAVAAVFLGFGLLLTRNLTVANDLHYPFSEELKSQFFLPSTWGARGVVGLGEYAVFVLWNWPVSLIFGFLGKLGLGFDFLIKILGFLSTILIGLYSITKLLSYFKISTSGKLAGTIFYLLNSYIILLLDGGQLNLALSYSVLPLAFVFYRLATDDPSWNDRVKFAIAVLAISIFDIRILYFLALLIGLNIIFDFIVNSKVTNYRSLITNHIKLSLVAGLILTGFHAYWILPAILSKAPSLPLTYGRSTQIDFLSFANLGHSVYLLQPHWFKNVFGKVTPLRVEFGLIPILVFFAPILRKKDKVVGFWLLVALTFTFLVKGTNDPLPGVYPWLFRNIPGFSLFRDPTKFFFLVALSYSVLLGLTVDELTKRLGWSFSFFKVKIKIVPTLLIAYLLSLIFPVYTGQMTGTFAAPVYQKEYFELADKLKEDKDFGRIFWIPTKAPLGYSSPTHPSVEARRLVQKRPFAIGTVGRYEIFNFLREAPFIGELFDIAGIKYIAYPFPDRRREPLKQDNIDYYNVFLSQLSSLDWIARKLTDPPVAVLKTEKNQDHFFITPNTFWVVGSDRIYWDLMDIPSFDLSKNALVFVEESVGLGNRITESPSVKVVLYNKEGQDLAASFISPNKYIFPAENLDSSPNKTGWWKREGADLISWRTFLQEKYGLDNLDLDYGGGWAVAEGSLELKVKSEKFRKENVLLARVMRSGEGGKLEFYQGSELIGSINTKIENPEKVEIKLTGYGEVPDQTFEYDRAIFSWVEIGALVSGNQSLEVRTSGDINVVNALISIPKEEWTSINESIRKYNVINWSRLTNSQKSRLLAKGQGAKLTYKKISPTHYKVAIEGLSQPTTLAFSETYDPLWQLDNQPSYPVYGLINGFTVEKDGEYEIIFSAQKYVLPGLYISGLTLIVVITAAFVFLKKHRI